MSHTERGRDPCLNELIAPQQQVEFHQASGGIDYVAMIAIITASVPQGVTYKDAEQLIRLVMLGNTLRSMAIDTLSVSRGLSGAVSYAPVTMTPDLLDQAWFENRLHLPLFSYVNNQLHAQANTGQAMFCDFAELIVKAAEDQPLPAGTILSMPLLSSSYYEQDFSLDRQLTIDELDNAMVPLLQLGDQLRIEVFDSEGETVFGAIEHSIQHSVFK